MWVIENYSGALRAIPRYWHTYLTSTSWFAITTSGSGVYNNRAIARMSDPDSGCTWYGTHVHEDHYPDENWDSMPNVTETTNSAYPTAAQCSTSCGTHKNNDRNKWTRSFAWEEGS